MRRGEEGEERSGEDRRVVRKEEKIRTEQKFNTMVKLYFDYLSQHRNSYSVFSSSMLNPLFLNRLFAPRLTIIPFPRQQSSGRFCNKCIGTEKLLRGGLLQGKGGGCRGVSKQEELSHFLASSRSFSAAAFWGLKSLFSISFTSR